MKIFKDYTYSWWQIGLFKLSLLSLGVVIGSYWEEIFSQYITGLLVLGIVLAIYVIAISLKQQKSGSVREVSNY